MKNYAYTSALAHESMEPRMVYLVEEGRFECQYDAKRGVYRHISHDDLEAFARKVAYKTAKNIANGLKMSDEMDPLNYIECDY